MTWIEGDEKAGRGEARDGEKINFKSGDMLNVAKETNGARSMNAHFGSVAVEEGTVSKMYEASSLRCVKIREYKKVLALSKSEVEAWREEAVGKGSGGGGVEAFSSLLPSALGAWGEAGRTGAVGAGEAEGE
eukprot:CAMPEP_0167766520 /NCGR_PEP_ID=MMETSP0110_2-20121227/15396_1 /TAXON_ID=629695 /ORGANISM="Gymnochlora sp., Strain CCMP2014" /LENGTH=131 /DNA_ID=CAMNT_0007654569 /DNA_START=1633 /DNA_END=2029 /DNA_ORIENTATION=+